jgi:hypothetical protein
MRLIAMVCGPHTLAAQTARLSVFSGDFKECKRFPKLATSSFADDKDDEDKTL